MDLRGLLLLIGILTVETLAAPLVIDKPGLYEGVAASRLVVNASDVVLKNAKIDGGVVTIELPTAMTAYRLKPTAGCVIVVGNNVTIEGLEMRCSSGVLIFNSTGVSIRGLRAVGFGDLPIFKRGVGLYVFNSSGVEARGVSLSYFHDCLYVEYSRDVRLSDVEAWGCRYGLHLMFNNGVHIERLHARDSYVGAALMYTKAVHMRNAALVNNRQWAEGYGLLLAEVEGRVESCLSRDNVHGIFILYWGGGRVDVENCTVERNYFGITLWGRDGGGIRLINNVIRDNVVTALHRGVGETTATVLFFNNVWGGHASAAPYVYSSAFSDLMTATEGDLAFLAPSPARVLIDSLAGRPIVTDPSPKPDDRQPSWLLVLAIAPVALWKLRRR